MNVLYLVILMDVDGGNLSKWNIEGWSYTSFENKSEFNEYIFDNLIKGNYVETKKIAGDISPKRVASIARSMIQDLGVL